MEIREQLKKYIADALAQLGAGGVSFTLEHPADLAHGDYATNAALAASKALGKNPRALAEDIVVELKKQENSDIESIEIAGPGFINFKLSPSFFTATIPGIVSGANSFGNVSVHAGQKILVEHSSANLFKPFHIGHMMNNAIGESLVRLMQASGAHVETMSFPSDISLGVAKAVFVLLEKNGETFQPDNVAVLGDAYVQGTKRYEDDEAVHARIKEIADNLYAEKVSPELTVFHACKKFNVAYFEQITKRLGSHIDSYIYESEAGVIGKKIVIENTPAVFTESEGAIVYVPDESKKNLNTSVFINSQGNPTYEAKDIGLLDLKFERMNPDNSIFITDYQQGPHFDVVLDAAEKINPIWANRSYHVPHGRMTFKGQKMSSRLGGVPLASEILSTVADEVRVKSEGREQLSNPEQIAIAAIKFAILRAKPGQNINFDPETSLSFEGDSGPYLQYTHARITSLIEKAAGLGIIPNYVAGQEISDLEKILYRLPEVVENAIVDYSPNYIVTYLLEIAHAFNSFYGAHKIVDETDIQTSAHRLTIAQATQVVIKNSLNLLGIAAPERM